MRARTTAGPGRSPSGVPVRDSKAPHGPVLVFAPAGWSSFDVAVENGHFSV
ncbi:DUF397 domain-containing protein [Streptomyces sp. NPDC006516]|uniref:DUF397 domain-containing protein n=1 Tax=Streptomyces sp. NPDC006516 TaxID=3154309 RepID=UPI0033BB8243